MIEPGVVIIVTRAVAVALRIRVGVEILNLQDVDDGSEAQVLTMTRTTDPIFPEERRRQGLLGLRNDAPDLCRNQVRVHTPGSHHESRHVSLGRRVRRHVQDEAGRTYNFLCRINRPGVRRDVVDGQQHFEHQGGRP